MSILTCLIKTKILKNQTTSYCYHEINDMFITTEIKSTVKNFYFTKPIDVKRTIYVIKFVVRVGVPDTVLPVFVVRLPGIPAEQGVTAVRVKVRVVGWKPENPLVSAVRQPDPHVCPELLDQTANLAVKCFYDVTHD